MSTCVHESVGDILIYIKSLTKAASWCRKSAENIWTHLIIKDGSYKWKDLHKDTKAELSQGKSLSSFFKNNLNIVLCNYISQYINSLSLRDSILHGT